MRALKSLARSLAVVALIAGFVGFAAPASTSASHGAYITLHVFECGSTSGNIYNACHNWDWNALDGAEFRVAGVYRATDWGYVTWKPSAGTYTIYGYNLDWGYDGAYVFCSDQYSGAVLYDGLAGGDDAVTVTTYAGQEVICDWYYLY